MKNHYQPFKEISNRAAKERVAQRAAALARSGETIGAGSGSTAYLTILSLSERVKRGEIEKVSFVPTSLEINWILEEEGLRVSDSKEISWLFDGADAIDKNNNLIKGRGGALLREKELFRLTEKRIIVADESKMVASLDRLPIPIEIKREAYREVLASLEKEGAIFADLRSGSGKDGPVITESGNLLLDAVFPFVGEGLEEELNAIPGVVENGLLQNFSLEIIA